MRIPASRPTFTAEDVEFIVDRFSTILREGAFLSMGKYGEELEEQFARYVGVEHAVSCNSGTSALEMICRGLELEGGEVIIPSNTFIATANAVINAGAQFVFADCGDDMCLDVEDVKRRITARTRAVMTVHIGGLVSQGAIELRDLCEEAGIHLIEDAAQAHGSTLDGMMAGSIGVAAGFSFFSTKVMTAGEGGIVTTKDATLAGVAKSLREFGKEPSGVYVNLHRRLGYNWRMPEVCALLAIRQLKAVDAMLERRRTIAGIYDQELEGVDGMSVIRPVAPETHNYFKYIVVLHDRDRVEVHEAMRERGIQIGGYVYEVPLHKQPVFAEHNSLWLPKTEYLCARHICLPIYPTLADADAVRVAKELRTIMG